MQPVWGFIMMTGPTGARLIAEAKICCHPRVISSHDRPTIIVVPVNPSAAHLLEYENVCIV